MATVATITTARASRPARRNKTTTKAVPVDVLKAHVLAMCERAEAAVKLLRVLDLDAEDAASRYETAQVELMEGAMGIQAAAQAVEARAQIKAATFALKLLQAEDESADPLVAPMFAEARRLLAEARW